MWIKFTIIASTINFLFLNLLKNNIKLYYFIQTLLLSYLITYHLFYELN